MTEFKFKHIKAPAWASNSPSAIYFKVIMVDGNDKDGRIEEIGYIGLQENDLGRGLCNNFCYKTFEPYRGKGLTKQYVKKFVNEVMDVDCYRAKVDKNNIASQKVLEYAGFEKRGTREDEDGAPSKYGYTWKKF